MMKLLAVLLIMGLKFALGVLLNLLVHLPVSSLPAISDRNSAGIPRFQRSPQTIEIGWQESVQRESRNKDLIFIQDHASLPLPDLNKEDATAQVSIRRKSDDLARMHRIFIKQSESLVFVDSVQNKLVYNDTNREHKHDNNLLRNQGDTENLNKIAHNAQNNSAIENVLLQRKYDPSFQAFINNEYAQGLSVEDIILDSIFWAPTVENSCPGGFSVKDHEIWKKRARFEKIVKVEEGCGRMQNRLLTFHDASKTCARYRLNIDQIQGEMYSYYLSKLLGMSNVPPSTLQLVNQNIERWAIVHPQVMHSKWVEEKPVIFAQWIDGLIPAYIPHEFRNYNDKGLQPDLNYLKQKTKSELCELLQWSDLIIFDYLTANLDRVVNNMFNKQWNDQMMNRPTHNLEKRSDGHLVFLDNESGLFHGYRLLDKYAPFHQVLLDSLCVFRKSTADNIERLVHSGSVGYELQTLFEENEPLNKYIPKIPNKNIKILNQRLLDVYQQIQKCRLFSFN
ncbi:hypothetical protein CHS0354_033636 [Potamilus streckersoni]|uniref:Uncharacterized protein n=1 Tax=Potamilus streckersoni TaxID=2493646 RepID=A0AAE0S2Q8_9BIVA|nr:hypothetical protein CHS0354_033636 [Potamilus streckersoni]